MIAVTLASMVTEDVAKCHARSLIVSPFTNGIQRRVGVPSEAGARYGSRADTPVLGQQGVDLGPERPPGYALGFGELRQGVRIAELPVRDEC